jgi:hypothetical protein
MKITKKQYTERKAKLETMLANAIKAKETLCDNWQNTEANEIKFYELCDVIRDIEGQIEDLETDYRRRNWTAADYARHELVINNID